MSDNKNSIPKLLRDALKSGKVIPFVGAGVSMSVRKKNADGTQSDQSLFPSWKGFVERLAAELKEDNKHSAVKVVEGLIEDDRPEYLEALERAKKSLGDSAWYRLFEESFDKAKNEAHEDSFRLNNLIWKLSNNLIITTNVDRVFQWTCPEPSEFKSIDVQNVEYAQLQSEQIPKRPTVWYLHGHIDHKEKVIFTREQFEDFYKRKGNEAKFQTLITLLTQRTFLFVGFSLDDDYLRELLEYVHNIYKGGADSFYILFREKDIATANFPEYVTPISFSDFGKPLEDKIEELINIAKSGDSKEDNKSIGISSDSIRNDEKERLRNHFNVPFASKGAAFIGREGLREKIWESLDKTGRTAISQIVGIRGIGGLGKTQLAVEYAHSYRDKYQNGIFWLTADEDIDVQLIRIGGNLRWISESDTGFDQAALVRNRFRKLSDCLIVFDNVDEMSAIENYLPEPNARPHILITSREKQNLFDDINLDVLSRDESKRLLLDTSGRAIEDETERSAFERILDELGDLPLAVELVGGFLAEHSSISFQKYLEFLEEVPLNTLEEDFPSVSFTKHDKSIIRTLKISEKVLTKKPYLEDILDVLAWSGKFSMGYSLLQDLTGIKDDYKLTVALSDLVNLRLIKEEKDLKRYAIHRLVARVRKFENPLAERKDWHQRIFKNLVEWFRTRKDDFKFLKEFEAEIIHLQEWQSHSSDVFPVENVYATAFRAYPLWHRGIYRESKILLDEALSLYQKNSLNDNELLANLYNDLGVIIGSLGEYQQSLKLQQSALETISKNKEFQKSDYAKFLNNIGGTYGYLGDHKEALKYHQQALEIRRELFGEKHPDTATLLNNTGTTYGNLGDHREALRYKEQALDIQRELFGEKHPDTATSLNNVGTTYGELGDYKEALRYYEQALDIQRELLGEKHPDTAASLGNIGGTYGDLGDHKEALKYHEQALDIYRELFGEKHPGTATSLSNVGTTYGDLGDHKEALKYQQQALEIRRELLGNQHPNTVLVAGNLITTYLNLGDKEKAGRLAAEFLSYVPQNHPRRWYFEKHGAMYHNAAKKKKRHKKR